MTTKKQLVRERLERLGLAGHGAHGAEERAVRFDAIAARLADRTSQRGKADLARGTAEAAAKRAAALKQKGERVSRTR
jgi:hypothetical protein